MRSISCFCKNLDTTSGPKVNDTPRSFSDHPVISLSGSDHSKSHNKPIETWLVLGLTVLKEGRRRECGLTRIRNIGRSHYSPDLLHALEVGTEPTMHCEYLLVNDGSDREAVEAVGEGLP